ncbi:MAG: hypothetical protein PVF37_05010 [Desulfobacterales bacterium]|jgi:dimethylamine--corrinoid protein Co-methyltransferase
MEKIVTRMGDGSRIEMSAAEIQEELEAGAQDAADRAKVSALTDDEIKYLLDLEINCVNMFKNRVGIHSYKSFN